MNNVRPKVLAYYFPDYHPDPANEARYGEGWTEWDLVREATPRFPGHQQPRVPLRGYENEADPEVMAGQIDLAADHGIDGFIFDWYWYDGKPYLQGALEEGFLKAANRDRLEFSLMWANHDWLEAFPSASPTVPDALIYPGRTTREHFDRMAAYVVENYFSHPNHTLIDGRPRFSVYEIGNLISAFGSIEAVRDAFDHFDALTRAAGFPGLHLDIVVWSFAVLPSEVGLTDPADIIAKLGARSASSYVWVHHLDPAVAYDFPSNPSWAGVARRAFDEYERYRAELPIPFHPNVTCGWDPSPRCDPRVAYEQGHYPWIPGFEPSLDAFREGLALAAEFQRRHGGEHREVTINAWNEWTEGSYLLPDTHNGLAYLEAVRDAFPREQGARHV
ncbi:glycoside hydrolase family 99-like domain-containing protein [Herbiconiux sp. A18JL235]|uniref:Glycoside hydrolase family 99-like domain-containing protein n=1 Tax=Herbiconiux sp. A18JL235 TaxID=3152363 RepID=A0AB39BE32_9MICO